jgi:PD-(D/E)XK nuclease superfamily protein
MPRPLARKAKGEWAESAFLSRALALGLIVSKPWGDSARYDFAVEGRHGFRRVQVKSCWGRNPYDGLYHINTARTGNRRRYSFRQVDLIAAYIVPEDAWYFIPVSFLGTRRSIAIFPDKPSTTSRFERYREAWHLLT